jgi:hypothetical protein
MPAQDEAARQAAHERHVMEVWEHCLATKDFNPYLDMAEAIRASRQDELASTSAAKSEPDTPSKLAVVHQTSEDSPQSPFARGMDYWRAFYGKGGPGEALVQAGLFCLPDGTLVPAKSLPEARTARARLMEEARELALYAMRNLGEPTADLGFIVDKLAEGIARMEAETAGDKTTFDAALTRVWCKPNFGLNRNAFAKNWDTRIRRAWREYEIEVKLLEEQPDPGIAATEPADDPKLMHGLLADALDVVGVHRPESNKWIKGLPAKHSAAVSVLIDFVVERCCWDATAETAKADFHAEFLKWLEAAKAAHPKRYAGAEKLGLKAFATEINLSLTTAEGPRLNEKQSIGRGHTWKGIRLLPPSNEPAGDVAIRREAGLSEALRRASVIPTEKK